MTQIINSIGANVRPIAGIDVAKPAFQPYKETL